MTAKKHNRTKFCIVCGRKIPESSNHRILCSARCAKKRKNLMRCGMAAPYENATEPPLNYYSLGEIERRANKAGLSYGKYMQMLYQENQKWGSRI